MANIKHYMLTEPAFIAGALLTAGSRINSNDLGFKTVTEKGKPKKIAVRPPSTAIEVDERGNPKSEADADLLASVASGNEGVPIAPVQPHAPNPTLPQGAPAQPAGGVQVAENQVQAEPAQTAAPEASADAAAESEAPKRRASSK